MRVCPSASKQCRVISMRRHRDGGLNFEARSELRACFRPRSQASLFMRKLGGKQAVPSWPPPCRSLISTGIGSLFGAHPGACFVRRISRLCGVAKNGPIFSTRPVRFAVGGDRRTRVDADFAVAQTELLQLSIAVTANSRVQSGC
jgi:hypothetical protein